MLKRNPQTIETMKNKNPIFYHIKCHPFHRLGNVISAFIMLVDSLIVILTFGMVNSKLSWEFTKYRMFTKLYGDPKKESITDK